MVDIVPVTAEDTIKRTQEESSRLVSKLNEPGSATQLTQSRNLAVQGTADAAKQLRSMDATTQQLDLITQQYLAANQAHVDAQKKLEPLTTEAIAANIEKKSANLEAHRPLAEENLKSIADMQATRKVIESRRNKLSNELNGLDENGKKLPGIVRFFNNIFRSDIEAAHNQALASQLAVEQTLAAKIGNSANLLALELSANQMQSKKELEVEQKMLQTQEVIRLAATDVKGKQAAIEALGKLHGWKKETSAAFLEQARTNIGLYSADLNSVAVLTAQQNATLARNMYEDYNEYLARVRDSASTLKASGMITEAGIIQYAKDTWEGRGVNQFLTMYGQRGATFANQISFGVGQMDAIKKSGLPFSKLASAAKQNPFDPHAQQVAVEAAQILRDPVVQEAVSADVAETLLGPGKTWKDVNEAIANQQLDREDVQKAQEAAQFRQLELYTAPDKVGTTLWNHALSAKGMTISGSDVDKAGFSPETAKLVKSAIPETLLLGPQTQDQFDKGMQELVTNLNKLSADSADRIKFLTEVSEKLPSVLAQKVDLFGAENYPALTGRKAGTVTPVVKFKVGSATATVNPATPLGFKRLMQLTQIHTGTKGLFLFDYQQDALIKAVTGVSPQQIVNP